MLQPDATARSNSAQRVVSTASRDTVASSAPRGGVDGSGDVTRFNGRWRYAASSIGEAGSSTSVHSRSRSGAVPRIILSPTFHRKRAPTGCATPATLTPLSPWTTTCAPASSTSDDVQMVARHVVVRPVDRQRLVARTSDGKRERSGREIDRPLAGRHSHREQEPAIAASRRDRRHGRQRARRRRRQRRCGARNSRAVTSKSRGWSEDSPRATAESTILAPGTTSITVCPAPD